MENNQKINSSNLIDPLFNKIFKILKNKLSLFVWQGFFESLNPVSFENDKMTFSALSIFQKDWITDHYIHEIINAAKSIINRNININIIYDPTLNKKLKSNINVEEINLLKKPKISLNNIKDKNYNEIEQFLLDEKYSFESFVEGPSNKICLSAGYSIVENPGKKFSPLFLFGSVGLGKTHLLHAIGIATKIKYPNFKILYVSAEQWVNSYITAIRRKTFDEFRRQFRTNCDMLLVDDIQFLAGKEASQDEFFHTFNALHNAKKQIIVTSDKYPHEISGFEKRLKSRLSWGLFADISPPEFETRVLILEKKSKSLELNISKEILHFIASNISSSVRELEGALIRLSAYSQLKKITLDQAKRYLTPIISKTKKPTICADIICYQTSSYYNLKIEDIKGRCRQKHIVTARQIAMSLCRKYLNLSLTQIGLFFGGRDHSTVSASIKKINKIRETNISIQVIFKHLEELIFKLKIN